MVKYTDKIEQFLEGEMTEEQETAFKAQVKTDRDLAHEVEAHLLATDGIRYFQEHSSTEAIESEEIPEIQQPKPPGIIRRLAPAIAFAAAALIALLIWQPSQQSLYTPYVLNTTQMSSGKQALKEAQDTYNSGDYATALPLLEKFPNNISVQIAKANAEYNLEKFDAAAATLQPIASGNSAYKNTANWYLALTYLKQDKPEKAKAALRGIKSGDYYDKAQKLLKKIK